MPNKELASRNFSLLTKRKNHGYCFTSPAFGMAGSRGILEKVLGFGKSVQILAMAKWVFYSSFFFYFLIHMNSLSLTMPVGP